MQSHFRVLWVCVGLSLCLGMTVVSRGDSAQSPWLTDSSGDPSLSDSVLACSHESNAEMTGGNTDCESCCGSCCNLCPCNYFWAEGLILGRDNQSRNRPLVQNVNTEETLRGTGDLDLDWAGGYRIGYCTRVCDCLSAELIYFSVFDNSDVDNIALSDGLILPGDLGVQVNNFGFADTVGVRYSSDLQSAEANLVQCCCCRDCFGGGRSIELISGFRFLDLDESFGITAFDSAESTSTYRVSTDNDLYGTQIGARYRVCRGRWNWEATGKTGIYANHMEQEQAPIIDFPNFQFRSGRSTDETDVAFVSDLNLTAIYQLNCVWGVRMGYNVIWLEGVALAPDQVDFSNTQSSGRKLVDGGGVFLHGVNVGLEARW